MQIINVIEKHHVKLRHTVAYRLYCDEESITVSDQGDACKTPLNAYRFALLSIPGTDIKKCQEAACKSPYYAYLFAKCIQGADLQYCREVGKASWHWAY